MKKVYLLLVMCCLGFTNFAATWYSAPAGGDPSALANWWSTAGGTGTNPTTFATAADMFIVQSNMNMTAAAWTVGGSVTMNSGYISIVPAGGPGTTITFNGAVTLNSGYIWNSYAGGGFGGGTLNLNFHAPFTMNGNTSIDGNPAVAGGLINVNLYSDLIMTGTSFVNNNSTSPNAYTIVTFANTASTLAAPQHLSGTGSQAASNYTTWTVNARVFVQLTGNFNTEPYNSFTVGFGGPITTVFTVNGTIDCQTYNFNGTGGVNMANGGTMYTANILGVNGSVICTGTNTFSSSSLYFFNGTSPQVTGSLMPASFAVTGGGGGGSTGAVTINNPAGVTLSQSTTFQNGTFTNPSLTLTSGTLTLNNSNLIMGSAAPINGVFSGTAMIVTNGTGQIEKQFAAAGSFLYPVGDAAGNYSPITLNVGGSAFTVGAEAGVVVTNAKEPNNANSTNYINRYWTIKLSGITSQTYTVTTAKYEPTDVVGTEANISAGKYPYTLPWVKYGGANTATHTLSSTAITNDSADFTGINTIGPSLTVTPNTTACSGTPVPLEVLSSTADAPATFTWTPLTGLSGITGPGVTATPTVTTTYTVTVTDGNGFKASTTTTLTINPSPGPILGDAAGIICLGQTTPLSDGATGGTWSSTNTSSASVDASGNVTGVGVGSASVIYTITGGCSASLAVSVISSAPPITGPTLACTGANTALSDLGTGTWSSSNTANATVNSSTGLLTGISPGSTVVTYTLAAGCVATSTILVNSSPSPITGPANACIGVTTDLVEPTMGGIWTSSTPSIATVSATGGVTGVATGSAIIYYTLPATGCSTDYPLGVVSLPPSITGVTTVCAGFTSLLNDAIAGGTWSSGNTALAVIDPHTGVATGVSPGTPSITYTLLPGCSTSIPFVVNSSGTPTVAISVSPGDTVCPGTMDTFRTTSATYTGTAPTYYWVKNGIYVYRGTSYGYYPVEGDVIYCELHSNFTCRRTDSAASNRIALSTIPVVTPVVTISAVSNTATAGVNDTLVAVVTSVTPHPQYQWYQNDVIIPGATNSFYVINESTLGSSAYNCTVNSGDVCNTTGLSNRLTVTVSDVSVKQIGAEGNELVIAPNPNKGTFTMNLQTANNEPVQVVITNLLGEKISEFSATTNTATDINLNVATGVYLLSANTGSGRFVARIVVN